MSTVDNLPTSVEALRSWLDAGNRAKYVFFWGHQPGRRGGVGPWCLSQWWPAEFTVDGVRYATAEHYMMAAKARLFGDEETAAKIVRAAHPGAAKALGRQVRGFTDEQWHAHRFDVVVAGNLAKFGQHPELRAYLLGTGDRILVEASPLDRVWGIGLTADDSRATDPAKWRGLNLLGFALMVVRSRLTGSGSDASIVDASAAAGGGAG